MIVQPPYYFCIRSNSLESRLLRNPKPARLASWPQGPLRGDSFAPLSLALPPPIANVGQQSHNYKSNQILQYSPNNQKFPLKIKFHSAKLQLGSPNNCTCFVINLTKVKLVFQLFILILDKHSKYLMLPPSEITCRSNGCIQH